MSEKAAALVRIYFTLHVIVIVVLVGVLVLASSLSVWLIILITWGTSFAMGLPYRLLKSL